MEDERYVKDALRYEVEVVAGLYSLRNNGADVEVLDARNHPGRRFIGPFVEDAQGAIVQKIGKGLSWAVHANDGELQVSKRFMAVVYQDDGTRTVRTKQEQKIADREAFKVLARERFSELKKIALQKSGQNTVVKVADREKGPYIGEILGATPTHCVQKVGDKYAIVHTVPHDQVAVGHNVKMEYKEGKAIPTRLRSSAVSKQAAQNFNQSR